jgi:hypothetical protein
MRNIKTQVPGTFMEAATSLTAAGPSGLWRAAVISEAPR